MFITIGAAIGFWPTLTIIFATAIIGAVLVKRHGLAALFNAQENLINGQLQLIHIFDGLFLIVAGLLLITPGFVTDGLGFLLLFPQLRGLLKRIISKVLVARTTARVYPNTDKTTERKSTSPIIDGEFEEIYQDDATKQQTLK